MITSLQIKTQTIALFFLAFFSMTALLPLSAQAQCGGGFSGWNSPNIVITGTFTNTGGVLEGDFTDIGYEGDWDPLTSDMRYNTVDFLDSNNVFALFLNLFSQPVAFAQCGGGPGLNTPEASLTATPGNIALGESSTLEWGSSNVGRCTGDFFDTGGDTSGTVLVTPEEDTTYTLTCTTGTGNLTWQYQETDLTDLACPWTDPSRPYGGIPDCPTNPEGVSCSDSDDRCKINSGGQGLYQCVVETEIYACQSNGQEVTAEDTVTVGACSPAYNQSQWYAGGTQVDVVTERANNPISCDTLSGLGSSSYSHWNRQVTNYNGGSGSGPDVYDPVETSCYYYTGVTGTEAKPTTQDASAEYYFDSGSSCVSAPVTQCSDGVDNEPDGDTDHLEDAGCSGPMDDDESDEAPECSDLRDNDNDGLVDDADGGCDGSDTDDSELGGISATLTADDTTILIDTPATLNWECTDSTTASISTIGAVAPVAGGSVVTASISAAQASYELTCSDGTISDTDIVTISTSNPTVELTAASTRVTDGGSTTLSWDGDQVTSCTLTGTNALNYTGGTDAADVPSGKILTQTTFTVSCDGGVATDTVIVNTAVYIDEF